MIRGSGEKREMILEDCGRNITWKEIACICFGEPKGYTQEHDTSWIIHNKPEPFCIDHISKRVLSGGQSDETRL